MKRIIKFFEHRYYNFRLYQGKLVVLRRINLLLIRVWKYLLKEIFLPGEKEISHEEFYFRSIIYTLSLANFFSAKLIVNHERLGVFNFIDTKVILRSIIERLITQKYIVTDPYRLATMFVYWGNIEEFKFHSNKINILEKTKNSLALDMDFLGEINPWSSKKEEQLDSYIKEWEDLVEPKQKAKKSRTWSGLSLAEMARISCLEDIYKLTYRETSWYSHGLVDVSDFFLRNEDPFKVSYSVETTSLQQIECLIQLEHLLEQSFKTCIEPLKWELDEKDLDMTKVISSFGWIAQLLRLDFFSWAFSIFQ